MVASHGMTDTGRVRPNNEDQFLIATLARAAQVEQSSLSSRKVQYGKDRAYLFVVADGMGGHAGGQHASALAVEFLQAFLVDTLQQSPDGSPDGEDRLLGDFRRALTEADVLVCAESRRRPELYGMGTTVTAAYSYRDQLYVVHAGDSRCYLLHHGVLSQLTHDHTMAQEMVRHGYMTAADARTHSWRHVITNAVGGAEPGVEPEVNKTAVEAGDCLFLCSDGLTEMITPEEITAILQAETDPQRGCERLVALANERGGQDNITVIIARYTEARS
jgi:protein phosphatase